MSRWDAVVLGAGAARPHDGTPARDGLEDRVHGPGATVLQNPGHFSILCRLASFGRR